VRARREVDEFVKSVFERSKFKKLWDALTPGSASLEIMSILRQRILRIEVPSRKI